MEEIEVPIEKVQEHIHETAEHARERWMGQVALFSAVLAVVAAISALMAGHHSNEAMISQIRASDAWSFFQAKGIKSSVVQSREQLLSELGKKANPKDLEKVEEYKKEQEEISHQAKELEEDSHHHLRTHEILARAVTLFQVSIAIAAVSLLTKKKKFWFFSLVSSVIGLLFFVQGLLSTVGH